MRPDAKYRHEIDTHYLHPYTRLNLDPLMHEGAPKTVAFYCKLDAFARGKKGVQPKCRYDLQNGQGIWLLR